MIIFFNKFIFHSNITQNRLVYFFGLVFSTSMDYNIPNKLFDIPNDKEEEAMPGGIAWAML